MAAAKTGIGWSDEIMPGGMRRGSASPVYIWDTRKGLEIEMVYVPPGDFVMGADDSGQEDEQPRHTHRMPHGYYIGRYDTTWRDYRAFCRATGRGEPPAPEWGAKDDHPVVNVTWSDAKAFCDWAGLSLPTEAQWEKAARGTNGLKYPWGNSAPTTDLCVFRRDRSSRSTVPVGSRPKGASPYGALDMAGNVWQWCADRYDENAYARYARGDRTPQTSDQWRVLRGGSWADGAEYCRAALRFGYEPSARLAILGLRPSVVAKSTSSLRMKDPSRRRRTSDSR